MKARLTSPWPAQAECRVSLGVEGCHRLSRSRARVANWRGPKRKGRKWPAARAGRGGATNTPRSCPAPPYRAAQSFRRPGGKKQSPAGGFALLRETANGRAISSRSRCCAGLRGASCLGLAGRRQAGSPGMPATLAAGPGPLPGPWMQPAAALCLLCSSSSACICHGTARSLARPPCCLSTWRLQQRRIYFQSASKGVSAVQKDGRDTPLLAGRR